MPRFLFSSIAIACLLPLYTGLLHAQPRTTSWISGSGAWEDAQHWQNGMPTGLVRALLRGHSEIKIETGRQVVGGLTVGVGRDENVKLHVNGGELIVRRNLIQIGEEDRGSGEIIVSAGALHCIGATYIAAANSAPGRQCRGALHIRGGSFVTREMMLGSGPKSEATLVIEGSRAEAVHALEYVTMGTYGDNPPSTSTLKFILDQHGVTPITIQSPRSGLNFVRQPAKNICRLRIELSAIPPHDDVTLVSAQAKPRGEFDDLPEGAEISASFQGRVFHWTLTYRGGPKGCDVVLTQVRGHLPSDTPSRTRPLPAPPKFLWTTVPLREPLPSSFEPAFDGAEGFGSITKGGRGGREIAVENLHDSGTGSLRAALEAKGPRVITFRVSGVIALKTLLAIREPFVTILGQSAPGDGITLRGHGMAVMTNEVILRHLRIRAGATANGNDAIEFYDAERCIVDHCSFAWGDDETCSITGLSDLITIQHCLIAEGLNHHGHSMGGIAGGERVTWHHNLIAHCRTRNPRFADVVTCDFRNNVVYNWGDTAAYGEFERVNMIANWFKPGPSTTQKPPRFHSGSSTVAPASLFAQDNVLEGREDATRDNWLGMGFDESVKAAQPFEAPAVKTESAADAYARVLSEAGATQPNRDAVDARIIDNVRTGTGKIIMTESEVETAP